MLRSLIGSSFSLPATYPPHERGWLLSREPKFFNRSLAMQFQGKMNHKHNIQQKRHPTQRFQKCSQRFLALVNSQGNIEGQSFKQERLEHDYSSKHEDAYNGSFGRLYTFYRFTRPYATLGVLLQLASVSCLPVETMAEFSPTFFMGVIKAIIPTILAQIYNAGVNQLYDIEIDKANKKQLPIATGALSIGTAKAIVWIVTLMSLSMGIMSQSPALLCGILACLMYGTIYSVDLPFLRWKRDPILTATIFMFWRGFGCVIPYFIHSQKYILGKPVMITKSLRFTSVVMSLYSVAIATFKDIPDVDGDKESGIVTLSTKFGREGAFSFGMGILLIAYGLGMIMGISSSSSLPFKLITGKGFMWGLHGYSPHMGCVMTILLLLLDTCFHLSIGSPADILGHSALAAVLLLRSRAVDLTDKSSAQSLYMFIWKGYKPLV